MLKAECETQIAKAELSLDLLSNKAAGIGDHSTEDFWKNASDALTMLTDGKDRLATLEEWYLGHYTQLNEDVNEDDLPF